MNGLERDLDGRLRVGRLNVLEPADRRVALQYGLEFTPSYVLFDAGGEEIWRWIGILNAQEVKVRVEKEPGDW